MIPCDYCMSLYDDAAYYKHEHWQMPERTEAEKKEYLHKRLSTPASATP